MGGPDVMLGAARLLPGHVVRRRGLHTTAVLNRTRPPMIQFKYGHNKGATKKVAPAAEKKQPTAKKAPPAAPAPKASKGPSYTDIPIGPERLAFAREVLAYKNAVVHTYMDIKVDVTAVVPLVETMQEQTPGLSMTDVVLRCAALALEEVPAANAVHVGGGVIQQMPSPDVAAVTRGDDGVVSYSVVAADNLLALPAARVAAAGSAAAPGSVALGVAVSGDGSGVPAKAYRTVLAPGLSSVLTVGSTEVEVGVDDDDNVCVAQKITLGLTADPTVVDAFVAGEFLQALSALISDLPGRALATNEL